MFACIHGRAISKTRFESDTELVDLAFTFSPLVEQTTADTVVLDVSGQGLLFGSTSFQSLANDAEIDSTRNLSNEIVRRGNQLNLKVDVAVAVNPDVAIHAARSFKGVTVIAVGNVDLQLNALSIKKLDYALVGIEAGRAEEIHETFALWGIRRFGDLARLPLAGVAERLGQEAVRLQKLAQAKTDRRLNLVRPPIGFEQSLELEHPVAELEPLSFILSRLLNQLCANLHQYALATNEIRLRLKLENQSNHERAIALPVPMQNSKVLLRLLLLDIEAQPPPAPVVAAMIGAEPVKPRASQTGLFVPLAPEPEKLEITLARLAKLVGADKVGSPEFLDTHRPAAFRMRRFSLLSGMVRKRSKGTVHEHTGNSEKTDSSGFGESSGELVERPCISGFRIFRPPRPVDVQTRHGQPTRINARGANSSWRVRGKVVCASGPWRTSGAWWRADVWARDEWDVAVVDLTLQQNEVLCRIYRDMTSDAWFVEGIYD